MIDGDGVVLHPFRDLQPPDPSQDLTHRGVGVMVVMLPLAALFLPVDVHVDMGAADASLLILFRPDGDAFGEGGVQLLQESSRLRVQFQQRRRQHISRRAHTAFQIQCFHKLFVLPFGSIVTVSKKEPSLPAISFSSCRARSSCSAGNCSSAVFPAVRTRKSV